MPPGSCLCDNVLCDWLFFVYRIPRQPAAPRVAAWRKLKQIGALLLHDSVWVLPATPRTREQFQWLASEIREGGGEATLWEARAALAGQDRDLANGFADRTDQAYRDLLKTLRRSGASATALSHEYQRIRDQDFFGSALGEKVRAALLAKGEGRR